MKRLLILLPVLLLLGGCAAGKKRSIESISAGTGAAASSYTTKETPIGADKVIGSDSTAGWATKNFTMDGIATYILANRAIDLNATETNLL